MLVALMKRVGRVRSVRHLCCLVRSFFLAHVHLVIIFPFVSVGINDTVLVADSILLVRAGAALALFYIVVDPPPRGRALTVRICLDSLMLAVSMRGRLRLRGVLFVMSGVSSGLLMSGSGLKVWRGGRRMRLRLVHKGEHLI